MRRPDFIIVVFFAILNLPAFAQNQSNHFKMVGQDPKFIQVDETFKETTEFTRFDNNINKIYGLAVSAEIKLLNDNSKVELVFIDQNYNEYLIYETYGYLQDESIVQLDEVCEETCILDGTKVKSVLIKVKDAEVTLQKLHYVTRSEFAGSVNELRKQIKTQQNEYKIARINQGIKAKGQHWVAGPTSVSELSYSDKMLLFGQSTFPPGFEFYAGGIISTGSESTSLKSVTTSTSSPYIDEWDWRDRHGKNWITPVTNQGACGSCWAFASTGAVEAMVNVYFNQQINLDLAEQDVLSCSDAGSCSGGYPNIALDYIKNTGVVDEVAFPYAQADLPCTNKSTNLSQLIKISGRVDFGSSAYPKTDDNLKRMLIENGPISGGLYDWSHAMVLVGYKIVAAGDVFSYRDLDLKQYWKVVNEGDPLIGKVVWKFKNSWGKYFGDLGYIYVETPITNLGWTHAIQTPITSVVQNYNVVCTDADGDGYYWWGLGPKPANCPPCPDLADGDDSDPTLGPLDQYGYCTPISTANDPIADFTSTSTNIYKGENVSFTDLSANSPTAWSWEFTGGTPSTSTEQNPLVTYNSTGTFQVKLTVSNSTGTDSKTALGYITVTTPPVVVQTPVADFTVSSATIVTGQSITFTDVSTNNPTTWSWSFNGGISSSTNEAIETVTYNDAGTYSVSLTASNEAGSSTKTKTVTVLQSAQAPIADFTSSSTTIEAGQSITYVDASSNTPTSWVWNFAGGSPSSSVLSTQTVIYNTIGTYAVSLTATNDGGSGIKTKYITVTEPILAPEADFAADQTIVNEGQSVNFYDKSLNNPASWKWVFDGGNPSTSTERNPKVTYNNANSYKVTLTVTNAAGNNTKIVENYIHVEQLAPEYCIPTADASAQWISKVNIGEDVNTSGAEGYVDNSTIKAFKLEAGNVNSIQLTPGFSGRSSFQNWVVWIDFNSDFSFTDDEIVFSPSKSKSAVSGSIIIPANMELTTRMRIAMGSTIPSACDISLSGEVEDYTVIISQPAPQPPVADFVANIYTINVGESIQFVDLSTNDPITWQWYFPGSVEGSSTLPNPVITYNTSGVFDVSLTVSKPGFETSTEYKTAIITVNELGDFSYCEPISINSTVNYITGISIGTVFSNESGADKYSISNESINLVAGQNYNVELLPSVSSSRNFWRIWIDFNNDGDFDDADETLLTINNNKGAVVSSISIPLGANGTARMRVSMKTGKASAPCDDGFDGEVEDYEVSFGVQNNSAQMASSIASAYEMNEEVSISVYPNPTEDMLRLKLSEVGEDEVYSVYSYTGAKILENIINQNITEIDLSAQPSGMYILVVNSPIHQFTQKIIKK